MPKLPLSDARLAANRANAQRSTGPVSVEGKARSSANSRKHNLTGREVLLPSDDRDLYTSFIDTLFDELRPATALETELVQIIADSHWRLRRIRPVEESMFTLAPPPPPETAHDESRCIAVESETPPHIPPADLVDAGRVFLANSRAFANLALYEQRLLRTIKNATAELRQLQKEREAREKATLALAVDYYRGHKMLDMPWDPASDGFDFSLEQLEAAARRECSRICVEHAKSCSFKREKFEKRYPPKAA